MQDADVVFITRKGATKREDNPFPQIQLVGKKKVHFDVDAERDMLYDKKRSR